MAVRNQLLLFLWLWFGIRSHIGIRHYYYYTVNKINNMYSVHVHAYPYPSFNETVMHVRKCKTVLYLTTGDSMVPVF